MIYLLFCLLSIMSAYEAKTGMEYFKEIMDKKGGVFVEFYEAAVFNQCDFAALATMTTQAIHSLQPDLALFQVFVIKSSIDTIHTNMKKEKRDNDGDTIMFDKVDEDEEKEEDTEDEYIPDPNKNISRINTGRRKLRKRSEDRETAPEQSKPRPKKKKQQPRPKKSSYIPPKKTQQKSFEGKTKWQQSRAKNKVCFILFTYIIYTKSHKSLLFLIIFNFFYLYIMIYANSNKSLLFFIKYCYY